MASLNMDISETELSFTINKISQLVTLHSSNVEIQKLPWQLRFFKSEKENALALRITCLGTSNPNWSCAAAASMKLRSFNPDQCPKEEIIVPFVFCKKANHTGRTLISWTELFNSMCYVQNEAIKIDVKIIAKDITNNNKTNLQVVNRTRDAVKLRLTVHDAISLVAAASTPFDFNGLSWKIVVFGVGYRAMDKTKFSSMLWCISETSTQNWSRDILGKVSLIKENVSTPDSSSRGTNKAMNFNQQCHKKFFTDSILWSNLVNPSNGYIRNDYIVLEIDLKSERAVGGASGFNGLVVPQIELPCSICFESMVGRQVVSTVCGHMYCKTCIIAWINERPNCPLCDKVLNLTQLHQIFLP